ncbi:anti-sigma factor antagonist [Microbispora sp. NPDC049125]|uniref:STAS domain-containing protein n=1 Tax=Microbispora sp. NPDC049125 TaxID=3154929 RepID=UPI0034662773
MSIGLHEDCIVVRASGELDHNYAGLFQKQIKEAWHALRSTALVVDLSEITFCDSMGVGVLVLLLHQSRAESSPLVLTGIPPQLERILTLTGLRSAFVVEPSVEEAIQKVKGGAPPAVVDAGTDAPAATVPAAEAPAEIPQAEAPAVMVPAVETPAVMAPAAETPAEIPVAEAAVIVPEAEAPVAQNGQPQGQAEA